MNAYGRALDKEPLMARGEGQVPEGLLQALDLTVAIVCGLDGTILFCTTGASEFYGWSKEEMMGKSLHGLLQTEFPASLEAINSYLLSHGRWNGEVRHVRRDGSSVWVASHWTLQTAADGKPVAVVEVSNDITDFKLAGQVQHRQINKDRAFRRLRSLNRRLQAASDSQSALAEILDSFCAMSGAAAGSLLVADSQTQTLRLAAAHGFSSDLLDETLRAGNAWRAVHDAFGRGVGPVIREDTSDAEEPSGLNGLGPPGFCSTWSMPLRAGADLLGVFSTYFRRHRRPSEYALWMLEMHARLAVDCLERIQATSALRQSEFLNKQILDNIPECIFVMDVTADGRFVIVELNPAEEKAVGLSSDQVAGKFIEEALTEDVVRSVTPQYLRCVASRSPIDYEGELNLAIGPRYFRTHLIPLQDATGRVCRLVGCCHDLTEARRSHEEALARQKLETIGALANGIAHDFNNLLGGILASAELALNEKGEGVAVVEDELQRIRTASIRGAEIVRELMVYGGKESTVLEAVDGSALVGEMLQLLKVAVSKNAVVEANLGKRLPAVLANPTQLRQIVMNLVTNASEAIGENAGAIRVSTSLAKIKKGSRSGLGLAPGDYVMLEVSDSGSGMALELQRKAFDPFFTTKSHGRGLGLSIVQGIVRAHRGAIHLVSAPGQGTTIQVLLPSLPQSQTRSSLPDPVVESKPRSGTVLVVEDEELLRTAVTKALRRSGFVVIEANNGSAAIKGLEANKGEVTVALLDATLPGMSVRDIYDNIKRIQPGLKVVFTSAYGPETVGAALGGLPLERYVRKPFRLSDLVEVLRAAISA